MPKPPEDAQELMVTVSHYLGDTEISEDMRAICHVEEPCPRLGLTVGRIVEVAMDAHPEDRNLTVREMAAAHGPGSLLRLRGCTVVEGTIEVGSFGTP